MSFFENLISELKSSIVDLANNNWQDYKDAVIDDGTSFLNSIKDDLEKWTLQLLDGSLSKKDFEWLIKAKKDVAELNALKNIGLAKASLDKFMNDLLNTLISGTLRSIL